MMGTQDLIDELRRVCAKIKRARLQCSEDDLKGKYKRSFDSLVQEAKDYASELLIRAMFAGVHCWDCTDTAALDRELTGLVHSEWWRCTHEECGRNIERGDAERVLAWMREARDRVITICRNLMDPEKGYVEDSEEALIWLKTDQTFESMTQVTNSKQS